MALGLLIYHLNQPATGTVCSSGIGGLRDLGGEGGFREGGFSLARGLFGIAGDMVLVAIVTVIVVAAQKALAYKHEPVRTR